MKKKYSRLITVLKPALMLAYLLFLLPSHILKMPATIGVISIFLIGAVLSFAVHRTNFGELTTLFLVLHMSLEMPHMLTDIQHEGIAMIFGHGLHAIFDLTLLYVLSRSVSKWILLVGGAIILGYIMMAFGETFLHTTKPFVLGGIVSCFLSHTLYSHS